MKHKPKTSTEIAYELAQANSQRYTAIGAKVGLLLSILILYDMWGFNKEDIDAFLKHYQELFESYAQGNENVAQWMDNVKEELDIDIRDFIRRII